MNKYSFWNFINNHRIEIPIIQRDYAQGRTDKSDLRKSFLTSIKDSLSEPNKELKLDFIYGSEMGGCIKPLDGQQRLTTLWLLHWYLALISGELNKESESVLVKFSYETRITSRDFCKALCDCENFKEYKRGESVVEFIVNQTWFYSSWEHDPTIQSMLTMLKGSSFDNKDGIESVFGFNNGLEYWETLISENCPVVFYYLPLRDFGLTDDLYIKMNARGKQLTPFENFKADFINEMRCQNLSDYLDVTTGVPIKIDTTWTDIFWKNKTHNKIDEIYFVFLKRFFANELIKDEDKFIDESDTVYKYLVEESDVYTPETFSNFQGLINGSFLDRLVRTMDGLSKVYETPESNKLFQYTWDCDFMFVPQYVDKQAVSKIYQPQRVVFYAICRYLSEGTYDSVSFRRWMRFVWNMTSDNAVDGRATIRSVRAMRTAMNLIDKVNDSHCVYECLRQIDDLVQGEGSNQEDDTALTRRFNEEVAKAKQIMCADGSIAQYDGDIEGYSTWEDVILYAEKLAFFKGSIRFLIRDEKGAFDWSYFDVKLRHAKEYFDKSGVVSAYKVPITKALIMQCGNWWKQVYNTQIFNTNAATWNWILGATRYISPIHAILVADNLDNVPIVNFDDSNYAMFVRKESLPFDEMVKSNPTGRFRWHSDRLGYYKPYGQDAITFDWADFDRNMVLTQLCNEGIITTTQRIGNTDFYKGWSIDFGFEGKQYQWHTNNHIYLIVEGDYCPKEKNGETEEKRFYCFDAAHYNSQTIIEKLILLRNQYEAKNEQEDD